jgi:superfamily II DNA/RNA helicase
VNALFQHLTVPDLWQQEAVKALRAGKDVVVHAPTGAGKTYIFEMFQPQLKGQAVFTVPTRALANDKLTEWRERGWDVGISTGDLALRLDAHIVVATLETQRRRFLRREGPQLLVVDEYQMIGDPHRGVNYELALALAPPETQLLLLSGSVGNPQDVVAWLRRIGRDAVLISHDVRPVPLTEVDLESLPNRAASNVRGWWPRLITNALRVDLGPVLMFAPRRKAAEEFAQSLASALPEAQPLVLSPEQEALAGPKLTRLLHARVAYHHSGLSYAQRAGVVEPLAKNGQLRVVVATMGLAAGINFSMRSVVVTDTRYMAGNFERVVQADELLQMFGRAGRRGLDETGHVLFSEGSPRLLNASPRQLRRATKLDWPTFIAVMHGAVTRGEEPFGAALESSRRLFSPQNVPLGVEHARATGPMPCGLGVDMERARFIRRAVVEIRNSRGEWQPTPERQDVPLGEALILHEGRWRPALSVARTLDGLGFGQLCRLDVPNQRRYGRELVLGTRCDLGLALAPWLRKQMKKRHVPEGEIESTVLDKLLPLVNAAEPRPPSTKEAAPQRKQAAQFSVTSVFERGEQLVVHLDFSPHRAAAYRDRHGLALIDPESREIPPPCCEECPEASWCRTVEITATPAWIWRRLGLIEPGGRPTRRGILFSFFHHGEGLAIAAALEDAGYEIRDLIFDLANLRAGPRFAGDDSPFAGRLGALCAKTYERADLDGYLTMGVPVEYGAGASEIVREIVEHGTAIAKLQTETLRTGDIERAWIEWRSVLRHIALAPDHEWDRWRELRRAAAAHIESGIPARLPELPPLTAAQRRKAQ